MVRLPVFPVTDRVCVRKSNALRRALVSSPARQPVYIAASIRSQAPPVAWAKQGSTLREIEEQLATLGCAFQGRDVRPFLGGDGADPSVSHGFVQSGFECGQGAVGGGFREAGGYQVEMPRS